MLRKLIKHELRATGRILLPVFVIVLVLSVGNNISSRLLLDSEVGLLVFLGGSFIALYTVALVAMGLVCVVLVLKRFHSNFLTDEGYVMMTLPVSVHQLIWSKLLVALIWAGSAVVVVGLSSAISLYRMDTAVNLLRWIWEGVNEIFIQLTPQMLIDGTSLVVQGVLIGVFSVLGGCLMVYAALALGHSFHSHKIIFSILFYLAAQWVSRLVTYLVTVFATIWSHGVLGLDGSQATGAMLRASVGLSLAIVVVSCAVYYGITAYCLTRRLNLS